MRILFLASSVFNKGVLALNYILMLQFEFAAQAVPHQCIAHHGAEAATTLLKEHKNNAHTVPSSLIPTVSTWPPSCPSRGAYATVAACTGAAAAAAAARARRAAVAGIAAALIIVRRHAAALHTPQV